MAVSASLTRRRALGGAAAAAAGTAVLSVAPPSWAARAARPRGFALDVRAGSDPQVLRAPRRFDLVGAVGDVAGAELRVRRRGGPWSPWAELVPGGDHRPDAGRGPLPSEPVWAGGADEVQVRARRARTLRLQFVAVPRGARRSGARAAAAARRATAAQVAGSPPIVPRAAWGGDAVEPRGTPDFGQVQLAFVHHTVNANDYTPEEAPSIVLAIAKYHRDTNGWNDLGYNFVVDRFGTIYEGRAGGVDQAVVGAQAQGYNSVSTGIAVLGTFGSEAIPPAALEAVARLIAWKLPLHAVPVEGQVVVRSAGGSQNRFKAGTMVTFERIAGHRDGCSTSCPGNALYAQLPALRARTAAIAPEVTGSAVRLAVDPIAERRVGYGAAVPLRGRLQRADGTPVAGQRVTVQRDGSKGFVTVAKATTDADGAWSAEVVWKRAGKLRARAAVPGAAVAVTSPVALGVTATAVLRAASPRVRAGRSVTLDATVGPVRGSAAVLVERQVGDRWVRVAKRSFTPRRRTTRLKLPLTRPGLYRLTLRVVQDGVAVRSETVAVRAVRSGRSLEPAGPSGGAAEPGSGSAGAGGVAAEA